MAHAHDSILWTVARVLAIPFIREQKRIPELLKPLGLNQTIEHPRFNYFEPYATLLSYADAGATRYVLMAISSRDPANPGRLVLATLNFPSSPNCEGPADPDDFTIAMFDKEDKLQRALAVLPSGLVEALASGAHEVVEQIVARHRAGIQRTYDFAVADCTRAETWLGEASK